MAVTAKKSRNLGIDLMRAMAMFFVICLHILGQGGLVAHAEPGSGKFYILNLLQILSYCAVDAYGITTGYLMCDRPFRLSRVTKLWLTTVFWSVAVSCCFFAFVPASRSMEEMVSMFLPILRGRYWFFTAYFVTMLVSPVLNVVIRALSKTQFKLLLGALFLIFGVAAAVFVLCVLLDAVRQWLFLALGIDRAADRLSDMAEKKIRKLMSEER